ncbi:hypothetical protein CEXT_315931 [Caerostris extrusa]|uniref:Uncharacterized protein n=1 Tax=Caerostris extrusa TaxID=172846 RepID=A0AAV4P141_CAEEX|nr:hypothetical protein CEXT_315931 [Caerostris extrusa]
MEPNVQPYPYHYNMAPKRVTRNNRCRNKVIGISSKWQKASKIRHLADKEWGKITTFATIAQLGNDINGESIVNQGQGTTVAEIPLPSSLPIRCTLVKIETFPDQKGRQESRLIKLITVLLTHEDIGILTKWQKESKIRHLAKEEWGKTVTEILLPLFLPIRSTLVLKIIEAFPDQKGRRESRLIKLITVLLTRALLRWDSVALVRHIVPSLHYSNIIRVTLARVVDTQMPPKFKRKEWTLVFEEADTLLSERSPKKSEEDECSKGRESIWERSEGTMACFTSKGNISPFESPV